MKKRYEILHAIILISFLVIANIIDNPTIKGVILLLFSAVLIINTVMKLETKKDDKFKYRIFYSILLFFEVMLAVGSIVVILSFTIAA